MSYILDALRRADAERERSEAPGLHAQHLAAALPDDGAGEESRRARWLVVAGVIAVAAALGWFFGLREPAPPPAAPTPMAVEHPPEPAAVPAARPVPPPPAPTTAPARAAPPVAEKTPPAVAVVTSLPPMPAPEPPAAPPPKTAAAPAPAPAPIVAAAPAPAPPAAASASPAGVAAPPRPVPPASAVAAEPRIPTQAELPDDLRREIPALVVGGAMYSPTPANRMLILNGQVTHEGDQPAPGLVLEQINLKTAVLRYKGQRFRIAY